ncbi:MAG: helix-turn-helix transcriptional regulator [Halioglobus sp.]|nr:helix-turn-helix transcriptional regulator [Halioglobus sp.]
MAETLFAFDRRNYLDCQTAYRGSKNQEYYLGNYSIEAGSVIDVRAEKKAVGSCSIIRLRSKTRLSFQRTWTHIREDATDVTVLWFVKRGMLRISHQCGQSTAEPGDFAVTRSMTPFSIQCETDSNSVHEVFHLVVPTHIFQGFIPKELKAGFTLCDKRREFGVAERLLNEVFEDEDELAPHLEKLLLDSALTVVAEAVNGNESCMMNRQSLPERRLQDVLRYIDIHLSDPCLSTLVVAEACDMSPRYLSFLLKENGTPFSDLIWDKRMKIARRWLSSTHPGDISIAEIAFRVGFKSAAHFSRMFKRVYKQGPREFRASALAGAPEQGREQFPGGSAITLQ